MCTAWQRAVRRIFYLSYPTHRYPDNKVHGANMGPTWGRQDSDGTHVGPMNFSIWVSAAICCWVWTYNTCVRDNLINKFKNFFDSLMSSSNAIVQLLAFNAVFNNIFVGLNRKFVSSRNSARTDESEKENGLLLCSLLHIHLDHWYIPQFQRDAIYVLINKW